MFMIVFYQILSCRFFFLWRGDLRMENFKCYHHAAWFITQPFCYLIYSLYIKLSDMTVGWIDFGRRPMDCGDGYGTLLFYMDLVKDIFLEWVAIVIVYDGINKWLVDAWSHVNIEGIIFQNFFNGELKLYVDIMCLCYSVESLILNFIVCYLPLEGG